MKIIRSSRVPRAKFPFLGILVWLAVFAISLLIVCGKGIAQGRDIWRVLAGQGAPLAALLALLWWAAASEKILYQFNRILMLGTAFALTLALGMAAGIASPYFMPVAYLGMLLAMTQGKTAALAAHTALVLACAMMGAWGIDVIVPIYVSGMAGIYLAGTMRQRYALLLIGLTVGSLQSLIAAMLHLYVNGDAMVILVDALWCLAGGILSSVLLLGTLPLWENLFSLLTPYKLMELADPNQPLLKRLLIEAPGTYHHSVMVANLAESAAEAIGADALLARVGSYYHDIGKLNAPGLFKENQGGDNPHDHMRPQESAAMILSHVQDGLALARRHKLPKPIQSFIAEHHGTTMAAYFYRKACQEDPNTEEAEYRYTGPLPQSRESAIVMLADAVESAARSMRDAGWAKIQSTVIALMDERMRDGQLDQCSLTVAEVRKMQGLFLQGLKSLYHERVEYPKTIPREEAAE